MTLEAHLAHVPRRKPIDLRFQDEPRISQKNSPVRQWARRGTRRGTRPRQPADQRYESAYLFGAIRPARGVGGHCKWIKITRQSIQTAIVGRWPEDIVGERLGRRGCDERLSEPHNRS